MSEDKIIELLEEMDFHPNADERYVNKYGALVPRVTEILSEMTRSENIVQWANSIGLRGKVYLKALNEAAMKGTIAHNSIEKFLRGEKLEEDKPNVCLQGFLLWYNALTANHKYETISMEEKLVCDWFGGTYDLLCTIDGRYWLVDFKTSNHISSKYFMQLAAYVYMLRSKGISVSGVIILQLSKETPGYNEYVLDFSNYSDKVYFEDCTRAFFSLVYAYYNRTLVDEKFGKRW